MKSYFLRFVLAPAILFVFFSGRVSASGDTLSVPHKIRTFESSLEMMSEPELVLLMDSLIDADIHDTAYFSVINRKIMAIRNSFPKNDFGDGFAFYPANRYYGVWDSKHVFPYSDSLYKADTLVPLDLSAVISGAFKFPFNGKITSYYGWRDSAFHRGIDVDLNRGDSVRSAFGGMVRFAARFGGFGNVVIVRHYNGLETVYAHLWKIKVKPGDIVSSGQLLGLGGSTGHSTGTHLHFEMRFRGVAIDPGYIINLDERTLHHDHIALIRTRQGYGVRLQGREFHTVKKGDTTYKIAQRYGITMKELKAWNGWDKNYVRLKAGQQVRIEPPVIAFGTK